MDGDLSIIGLAGSNGSGKDTLGTILSQRYGYMFISVTEILRAELKKRGKPVTRANLRTLSSEWRRQAGMGVLVDQAMAIFKAVPDPSEFKGLAIASLRHPGEAQRIHELGGTVIWLDADPRVRYARIRANATARARSGEDNKTYEEFLAEESVEMNRPRQADESQLNMSGVKARADLVLDNSAETSDLEVSIARIPSLKAL